MSQQAPVALRPRRPVPALDAAIAATADDDPQPWRPQQAFAALVAIIVVLTAFGAVVQALGLHGWQESWATVLAEIVLAAPVVLYARPIVAASGGWGPALGLTWLRWRDVRLAVGWTLVQFGARIALSAVLLVLLPAARHERVSNVPTLDNKPLTELLPLIVAIVVMAPIVEELAFRGLMLRIFMRRWGFVVAAIITSVLFGLLHFEQAGGPAASVILAATLGLFGYLQAVVVRRTARLAPAMLVHALNNGVVVLFALHLHFG
ncbi:MAG: protease family protein [Actinomycetota bacterium]|jgi:membrane protease YdiL (CAAX protease family)|nr:protease family protein [Actinomycetota bacterium]